MPSSSVAPTTPLKNSLKDAEDVQKKLLSFGFKVKYAKNPEQGKMLHTLGDFIDSLNEDISDIVVYYAGHGCSIGKMLSWNVLLLWFELNDTSLIIEMSLDGVNYLIPVNGSNSSKPFIAKKTFLALDEIIEMISAKGVSRKAPLVVILDCCRTEMKPEKRSQYVEFKANSSKIDRPNTCIIYATAGDNVALDGKDSENSVFTELLLKYMDSDDTIDKVFENIQSDLQNALKGEQVSF